MIFTWFSVVTTFPASVQAQLPPVAAAKSTTTEPGFMESTISFVIKRGAGLPGIAAVVIMISTSLACSA